MRIGIIADWMNPNMVEMARLLEGRGVKMEMIYPEQKLINLSNVRVENDLYLLKSGSDLALSLACMLHELGAVTLNPYPTAAMMQNKIVATRILQMAGVPTPDTFVTSDRMELAPLLDDGPLIIKPYRGSRGEGVTVVWSAGDLDKLALEGTVMAQRYYQSDDGCDHKIFCIGGRLFGVRRVFPLRSYADKVGEPFHLTQELRGIARRCGEAAGIDLFGVDVVMSKGQPYVVDFNKFCSYMGVEGAPKLLADYILDTGRRLIRGESIFSAPVGARRGAEAVRESPPASWSLRSGRHFPLTPKGATS